MPIGRLDAYRQVKARLDLSASDLGARLLKNIAEPWPARPRIPCAEDIAERLA
jgi:hypothetical protein